MTKPILTVPGNDGMRFYVDPAGELPKAIGVTSIVGLLDKPGLRKWYAKMAAEYALANLSLLRGMVDDGKENDAVYMVKTAADRNKGDAADKGTSAHGACEDILAQLLRGIPLELIEESLPKVGMKAAFVRQFIGFLKEFDAEPVYVEASVWNPTEGYAGTFDNALRLRKFDNKLLLVDIKTGASGLWPEVQMQLTAYAHGEVIVSKDGRREPMPAVDGAAALWLRPEGYALHPIKVTDAAWRAFLGLRDVYLWKQQNHNAIGDPVNASPIRREKWGNGK